MNSLIQAIAAVACCSDRPPRHNTQCSLTAVDYESRCCALQSRAHSKARISIESRIEPAITCWMTPMTCAGCRTAWKKGKR